MKTTLTIATRKSPLALWQAEYVADQLRALEPDMSIELLPMSTRGDKLLDRSLAAIGGKGLFLKELEEAMAAGQADLAVHSMKDVPADLPAGFAVAAVLARHDPRDALVSPRYETLEQLPERARVGTSSLRRQAQLLATRPDLQIGALRGNVNTRLAKLDAGDYDAIVLAASGLQRLGMGERITQTIAPEISLPAVAQGALGIECLADNRPLIELLQRLEDRETRACVSAERAVSQALGGSCQMPLAGFAQVEGEQIRLRALLASPDGQRTLRAEAKGDLTSPVELGRQAADDLHHQGAAAIIEALK
ncbi:MAG: hydroxymethylbilane synthase [Xanthomonadales bacterium]|nr:hydroxymethylbilane synthase [Xanthomonadales bacterium]